MSTREALDKAIARAAEANPNNNVKWNPAYNAFAEHLGVQTGVVGKLLTEERQLGNRIREMAVANPRYIVLSTVVGGRNDVSLSKLKKELSEATLPAARCALIVGYDRTSGALNPLELQVYVWDSVVEELCRLYPELTPVSITREESAEHSTPGTSAVGASGGAARPVTLVPMVIDERIRRAIRFSILTNPAVLLVGPPGAGKTTLLMEVIDEIRADPSAFGFETPLPEPMKVTPEESWSARELIGGMTIAEDERLRFREGYVLRAIRQDRWLVLDEANRADLDKIFGALLTWLSDQEVVLGPASTDAEAPSVRLGWSSGSSSVVDTVTETHEDREGNEQTVEVPVRYQAGREWRLLGTYNALDAQRVFRFGQALGCRFLRVPIPPIAPNVFVTAAEPLLVKLPIGGREAVAGLYQAHFESEETQLGPALFMRIPEYVLAGLEAVGSATIEDGAETSHDDYVNQLVAEAYLVNIGAFLARYPEASLAELGERVVAGDALPEVEWKWVLELSRHLG